MFKREFDVQLDGVVVATCRADSAREAIKFCKAELVIIGRKDVLAKSLNSKIEFTAHENPQVTSKMYYD